MTTHSSISHSPWSCLLWPVSLWAPVAPCHPGLCLQPSPLWESWGQQLCLDWCVIFSCCMREEWPVPGYRWDGLYRFSSQSVTMVTVYVEGGLSVCVCVCVTNSSSVVCVGRWWVRVSICPFWLQWRGISYVDTKQTLRYIYGCSHSESCKHRSWSQGATSPNNTNLIKQLLEMKKFIMFLAQVYFGLHRRESSLILRGGVIRAGYDYALYTTSMSLIMFVVVSAFVGTGGSLTPRRVFTTLSLVVAIRRTMFILTRSMFMLYEGRVAGTRIQVGWAVQVLWSVLPWLPCM